MTKTKASAAVDRALQAFVCSWTYLPRCGISGSSRKGRLTSARSTRVTSKRSSARASPSIQRATGRPTRTGRTLPMMMWSLIHVHRSLPSAAASALVHKVTTAHDRPDETAPGRPRASGSTPDELEACLRLISELDRLPVDHPDSVDGPAGHRRPLQVGQAPATAARSAVRWSSTTPQSPPGPPPPPRAGSTTRPKAFRWSRPPGARSPGTLKRVAGLLHLQAALHARSTPSTTSSAPTAPPSTTRKRDARTDLTGKRALLTGGRAKIGMYIALRLLRDGAHTTITTRFPNDAVRRFKAMEDSADWIDRLRHRRHRPARPGPGDRPRRLVAAAGPLDILINNACQTVRRTARRLRRRWSPPSRRAAGRQAARDRDLRPRPDARRRTTERCAVRHRRPLGARRRTR